MYLIWGVYRWSYLVIPFLKVFLSSCELQGLLQQLPKPFLSILRFFDIIDIIIRIHLKVNNIRRNEIIIIRFVKQKSVKMESLANARKNRMNNIRSSLQLNPIMKKNTIAVENKLQKRRKRKQSLNQQHGQWDQNFEEDDSSIIEMSKFKQKYDLGEKIGEGCNGIVQKCYLKETKQLFAVKVITMDDEHILFLKKNFKEIRKLNHIHIIKYKAMYLNLHKHTCYLVMDYEPLPNLMQFLDLTEEEIKKIMYQLLQTLNYIHFQGMCHRDIKPQNILYDREKQSIKIIDFGISKKIKERSNKKDMLTNTGTLFYKAPQMFLGGGYDEKVDIWAAGITMYYLITRRTPFQSEYHSETIKNIEKGEVYYGQVWGNYNYFARDLVTRLLKNRSQRLSAAQALNHLWLQELKGNIDLTKSDNLNFNFKVKFNEKLNEDPQGQLFRFQRSLTNHKPKLSLESAQNSDQKNKVRINNLKRWLTGSDDEDDLIQIDSEGELQKQSPFLLKNTSQVMES